MKKVILSILLLCMSVVYACAINTKIRYTHTYEDANGVTWHFIIYNNEALLTGAISGFGETVTIPREVYDGTTSYPVTVICGNWFIYEESENYPYYPNTGVDFTKAIFEDGNGECNKIRHLYIPNTVNAVGSLPRYAEIIMESTEPPLAYDNDFNVLAISTEKIWGIIKVPYESLSAYKNSTGWHLISSKIISANAQTDYDITVAAKESSSGIYEKLGENNLLNVISLKITGSINSYDFFILKTKMLNLHYLDISEANIVANDFKYYEDYCSKDNIITPYCFNELWYIKLPRTIISIEGPFGMKNPGGGIYSNVVMYEGLKYIGPNTFSGFSFAELVLPNGLETIADNAFGGPGGGVGENLVLPEGLKYIGNRAFGYSSAKNISFPSTLIEIGNEAFYHSNNFQHISLPLSLQKIGSNAFESCHGLVDIRIPSSVSVIGEKSFYGCSSLHDIYTYTVEPTIINQNTFDFRDADVLHVPSTSYYNYYWDTQWGQFKNITAFDEPYEYFYINNDYILDDNTGRIDGEPDADLNPGSGLIVEGDEDQDLDDVHVKEDDDMSSSIIGDGNINANGLYIDITIKKNKWYFLSFPYRIRLADIVCEGSYTFRLYDGEERANNGYGGWQHMPEAAEYLEPGQGYIFRCNQNTTLQIPVDKAQYGKFAGNDCQQNLATYTAAGRPEDASWNFLGNPYPCYFDIDETGYDGPITVWNGTAYESVRPGDDEYHLRPFEAFFVQKPADQAALEYDADGRHTYQQWDKIVEQKAQARRRASGVERTRHLINFVLSDGINTDKARVVFNEKCSTDYEIGTDAAKFIATDKPQLYTIDGKQVQYAINERPEGEVRLGYVAAEAGEMTISAKRMDKAVVLYDTETGISTDLSQTGYTFTTEAGTFNQRFILRSAGATSINSSLTESSDNAPVYTLDGVQVENTKARRVYIQEGKKIISK